MINKILFLILSTCLIVSNAKAEVDLTNPYPISANLPDASCEGYLPMSCVVDAYSNWKQDIRKLNEMCHTFQQTNIDLFNLQFDEVQRRYEQCSANNQVSQDVCDMQVYNETVEIEGMYKSLTANVKDIYESGVKKANDRFHKTIANCCEEM
jgi:hypothetical protein